MTSKTIIAGLIVIAFVAGSITTGTMAFAAPGDQGKPFEALQAAIDDLQTQIDSITTGVVDWFVITNIPADIADGDDDTQLSEAEVDAFVANNGFSTGAHTVDTNTNAATLCSAGEYLDGDGTCKAIPSADNLGDHTATQGLDMGTFDIGNVGNLDAAGALTVGGVITGDGSGLTNLPVGPGDNLGDHTATQGLDMGTFDIGNVGILVGTRMWILFKK